MTARSGGCLCGAVRFEAAALGGLGACHCTDCQKWCGGPLLGVHVRQADLAITGAEHVFARRTSGWASRARCAECGSPLWYRWDKGTDGAGNYEVPLGLFDDASGITLEREIFIDVKPDGFAFAGDHPRLTRAEVMASLAPGAGAEARQ